MIGEEEFHNLKQTHRIFDSDGREHTVKKVLSLSENSKTRHLSPAAHHCSKGLIIASVSGGFQRDIFWSLTEDCIIDEDGRTSNPFNHEETICLHSKKP